MKNKIKHINFSSLSSDEENLKKVMQDYDTIILKLEVKEFLSSCINYKLKDDKFKYLSINFPSSSKENTLTEFSLNNIKYILSNYLLRLQGMYFNNLYTLNFFNSFQEQCINAIKAIDSKHKKFSNLCLITIEETKEYKLSDNFFKLVRSINLLWDNYAKYINFNNSSLDPTEISENFLPLKPYKYTNIFKIIEAADEVFVWLIFNNFVYEKAANYFKFSSNAILPQKIQNFKDINIKKLSSENKDISVPDAYWVGKFHIENFIKSIIIYSENHFAELLQLVNFNPLPKELWDIIFDKAEIYSLLDVPIAYHELREEELYQTFAKIGERMIEFSKSGLPKEDFISTSIDFIMKLSESYPSYAKKCYDIPKCFSISIVPFNLLPNVDSNPLIEIDTDKETCNLISINNIDVSELKLSGELSLDLTKYMHFEK